MNIKCHLLRQAIIQLDDVTPRKSTKEHGYYIAVTSLNKIGEDSCVKRGIFLKSESHESIFLSRRQHELIINTSVRSSSVNPDAIDRRKQMSVQDLKHGIFLKSEPCKSRLNPEKTTGNHRYVVS